MTDYVYTSGGFPSAPVVGDTLTINSAQYDWIGTTWQAKSVAAGGGGAAYATSFPFYKANGDSDIISLISGNLPFFKADGTQDNIGVS